MKKKTEKATKRLLNAYTYSDKQVSQSKLIYGIVNKDGDFR